MLCAMAGSKQTNAQWSLTGNAATNPATNFIGTADLKNLNIRTNNINRVTIASDGKVGIGTVAPTQMLDVQNAGPANVNVKSTVSNANVLIDRFNSASNASVSYRTNGVANWQTGVLGNDNFSIRNIAAAGNAFTILAANSNVGIGTVTPTSKLSVSGNVDIIGNVGIGNSTPSQKLDVTGTVQASGNVTADAYETNNGLISDYNVKLGGVNSGEAIGSKRTASGNQYGMDFFTNNINRMVITNAGNIGIGTTAPFYKLQVSGDAMFNGVLVGRGSGGITTNTAVGDGALNVNSTGYFNTAVGNYALDFNTTGNSNTAVGTFSLYNNNGSYNTSFGYQTQYANTAGGNNAAFGSQALTTNSTGNYNSAFGTNAMFYNTASNNSAFGNYALFANNTGANNTATGYYAMLSNTTGGGNSAYGANSMVSNDIGFANTAAGYYSLYSNVNGNSNTAFGSQSLQNNVTGYYNTAVGQASLTGSKANDNTAVGRYTLLTAQTGGGNTAIGSAANNNDSSLANVTLLGFYTVGTASNSVQIGNNAVTSVKAGNGVVIVSDGRFKKNVQANVPGLDFINALKPVTYNYDVHGLDKFEGVGENNTKEKMISDASAKQYEDAVNKKEKIVYSGFIAQDVEKAAQKLGYDFSGVYKPQNARDAYGLSYAEFTVPLVKAVQELTVENQELKLKNESLENRLNDMQQCLETLCTANATQKTLSADQQASGLLKQNQPNPFNQTTVIEYQLAGENNSAQIVVRNLNGELIKAIKINKNGTGQITINANELTQGTYTYTLIVSGKSVDTKLMVVTK